MSLPPVRLRPNVVQGGPIQNIIDYLNGLGKKLRAAKIKYYGPDNPGIFQGMKLPSTGPSFKTLLDNAGIKWTFGNKK